jgi:K+/H+ antiporter YhaU regulatory subunit KhtT
MSKDSNLAALAAKLEETKTKEIEQIKKIEEEKLQQLSAALQESLSRELDTIKADMGKLSALRIKYIAISAIFGASVAVGLGLGSYAVALKISSQAKEIEQQAEQLAKLKQIKDALESYEQITGTYKDGIALKNKPRVFQAKGGQWVVSFE